MNIALLGLCIGTTTLNSELTGSEQEAVGLNDFQVPSNLNYFTV